jgi:xanthine dehydrogenase accessory factor
MTDSSVRVEPYGLGPALNQCCGGSVELLFEVMTPPAPEWLRTLLDAAEHGDPAVLATATAGTGHPHYVTLPVGRESELPEALRSDVREMLDSAVNGAIRTVTADGCDWWLERIARSRRPIWVFGGGHVGKAVVKALADLPFKVRWLDGRDDIFPAQIPDNVTMVQCQDLPGEVSEASPDTTFVVMTHSHELDEEICHAVLERGDFAFLGMIGSVSKRRRIAHRLGKRGIEKTALERLICPIGLPGIAGKEPATIALSLAAQLMSENGIR